MPETTRSKATSALRSEALVNVVRWGALVPGLLMAAGLALSGCGKSGVTAGDLDSDDLTADNMPVDAAASRHRHQSSSCTGAASQSCTITNGTGTQSRNCTGGVWSAWGACTISCNAGYVLTGNQCTPSGGSGSGNASRIRLDGGLASGTSVYDGKTFVPLLPYLASGEAGNSTTSVAIANTEFDGLYQTETFIWTSPVTFAVPVANGSYSVHLHFADWNPYEPQAPGDRLFNVDIQGARKLTNLDIIAEVGKNAALVKSFDVAVTNSVLTVAFTNNKFYGCVDAIEILPAGEAALGTSATTACTGAATQACTITNGTGSQSRTCNAGAWSSWSSCTYTCNTGYVLSGSSCVATTCSGSATQACTITNGTGSQSRTCNAGAWSSWSSCTYTCNTGYVLSGSSCVATTCSGSATQACTITNGTGSQSRTCNAGAWSSWSSCTYTCNTGYVLSGSSCVAQSSGGGTYFYVSTSGNDSSGNGSAGSPWRSLAKACSSVSSSGAVIHVNTGTYTEPSTCALKVGVSIEGEGSGSVIRSTVAGSYAILAESGSYASPTAGNQHISNIKLVSNTPYSARAGIGVSNRGYVEIANCEIADFNYYGVAFSNGEQSSYFAKGNKIHDCTITNSAGYLGGSYPSGDSTGSINIDSQDGLQIYNNTITVDRSDGLNGNCIDGVEGFLKNVKVHHNTLLKTFTDSSRGKIWDFAIEWWNLYEGNEIYENVINSGVDICRTWGVGSSGAEYAVSIHDNIIGRDQVQNVEAARGILMENYSQDIVIERNIIMNFTSGIFVNMGYAHDLSEGPYNAHKNVRIAYNLIYGVGMNTTSKGWGIHYPYEGDDHPENRTNTVIDNVNIYNNVIVGQNGSYSTMWGINLFDAGKATRCSIVNNIIYNFDSCAIYADGRGIAASSGIRVANNIFNNNGNNGIVYAGGYSSSGVTVSGTSTASPLFVDAANANFQISSSSSPAVDHGLDVGLTEDLTGYPVPNGGAPDIGAFEFH